MITFNASFSVVDSHTAGHPTRVVLSGIPQLAGKTVLDKRDYFRENYDHLRPGLLHEPRGHAAMVGLIPVASDIADFGCFFISSYVYLDMCGHGTIGYAKTLAASGQISPLTGDKFTLETPAGLVTVYLTWGSSGSLDSVRLANVPSFVGLEDFKFHLDGFGEVHTDIVYAGMWYALVDADALGIALEPENVSDILLIGSRAKAALKELTKDISLFADRPAPSVLFYKQHKPDTSTHLLVLEKNKFDRSPCGTGTSARLTQLLHKGLLNKDQIYYARNVLGIEFTANYADSVSVDGREAIVVEVEGNAYITAYSTILVEQNDPLSKGFLCR